MSDSDLSDLRKSIISLAPLFQPKSIAIVGASSDPEKPSGQPLFSLKNNGYRGHIYPVNPKYDEIGGIKCYPSLLDVPASVDLVIIAVAAKYVLAVLGECEARGVKAVIIITSGFGEVGIEGKAMQSEMAELAAKSKMRIVGPNCMGVFSLQNNLTAGFALTELYRESRVPNFLGYITQSGGFGVTMYEMAKDQGIGFTHFVSTGNEADVNFAEILGYIVEDPETKVIGGYLESIRDGEKFAAAADLALERGKPILLIKTGKSEAAAQAAASHTGSLAGEDRLYEAFFKQKGIIRVEDIKEFEAELQLLSAGKLPAGNKVCVLASSGGSAVFLADKCVAEGLDVAELQADTRQRLEDILPSFAATRNPVDMTSVILVQPGLLQKCADIVLSDPNIDSVLINHWVLYGGEAVLEELGAVHEKARKPLIVNVMGPELLALEAIRYLRDLGVPTISDAAYAARSLARLAQYDGRLKRHRAGKDVYVKYSVNKKTIGHELAKLKEGGSLSESEGKRILASCGIAVVTDKVAATADEAIQIAREIGFPVVLKVDSPDIIHKTEAGGVKLNIQSPEGVRNAYAEIMEKAKDYNPNARINGISVQEMAPAGVEVIVGGKRDPVFGPTVLFGLGGIYVEVMRDVALRVAPLSKDDAADMVREIKGFKILEGVRGRPPADIEAIQDVILKVSALLENCPQINEIDINPLLVYPRGKGARAVDALVLGNKTVVKEE